MKKILLMAALAAPLLAVPAQAKDGEVYIQLDGGLTKIRDVPSTWAGQTYDPLVTFKTGYDIDGVLGYDFGRVRLEAEVAYKRGKVATVNPAVFSTFIGGVPAGNPLDRASALSGMGNLLLDFDLPSGVNFYLGGGAGYATIKERVGVGTTILFDGSDNKFAWQGLAGMRVPVGERVEIGVKLRYFDAGTVQYSMFGRPNITKFRTTSALASLIYNFGSKAPVVETVMVPPPKPPETVEAPPPLPPPPCNKGPYIVFFDWDKSDITTEAAATLDSAVTAYGNCANVPVMLAGYADRSGAPAYNQALSERRNAAVTTYLTGHGISASAISGQGFGEDNNRVPTADGVRELQNRRVEITYGPGSGM